MVEVFTREALAIEGDRSIDADKVVAVLDAIVAWIESFSGRLGDELLNTWQFDSLLEARVHIGDWRIDYNCNRPHTAHGDLIPTEFATHRTTNQPKAA